VRANGFSVVELLAAVSILLVAAATLLLLSVPSQHIFSAQSEVSDMQQRLRVAADTLSKDLLAAGAGSEGSVSGPLNYSLAPILPYRSGLRNADPPGTYRTDVVTVLSVPRNATAAVSTTYSLKADLAAGVYQLMAYDGSANPDVPVLDNVVGLSFDYYGDPLPPTMRKPLADPVGPWTTYGSPPSSSPVAPFAAGENCTFVNDRSPMPQPRLVALGSGATALARLTGEQFTDGPWCPDDGAAARWDADLLRIRRVAVSVRVQAAVAALRGPAGLLFTHSGTARSASSWAPDQEIRFDVSPRNLNLGR
jgi:hypothetical protein